LQKYLSLKGLTGLLVLEAFSAPAAKLGDIRFGFEFNNENVKSKFLSNAAKNPFFQWTLVYKVCSCASFGFNYEGRPADKQLTKYDVGAVFEPTSNFLVGVKHESKNPVALKVGKLNLYCLHQVTDGQQVGSEFGLDWETKDLKAKIGASHKLDDSTTLKAKIDSDSNLNAVVKTALTKKTTLSFTSGLNLKDF